MYHPIRISAAPTRQDAIWTLEIAPWSGRDTSNTSLQLGELARLLAQPRGIRTASDGEETPRNLCVSWMDSHLGKLKGAYLTANYRPQKHMQLKLPDCVATREQHVIAMPNPRPIHEEKGSGCCSIGM